MTFRVRRWWCALPLAFLERLLLLPPYVDANTDAGIRVCGGGLYIFVLMAKLALFKRMIYRKEVECTCCDKLAKF